MRFYAFGTGPASGWPAYGHPTKKRRRPSTYAVECSGFKVLLDVGSIEAAADAAERLGEVHAILLSHPHADHWAGINFFRWGPKLPTYSIKETFEHPYFKEIYDKPFSLVLTPVKFFESFDIGEMKVTPFPLNHTVPATGFLIECEGKSLAYALDTRGLPKDSLEFLRGRTDYLVIDSALPKGDEGGHNSFDMALMIGAEIGAKKVFAVHLLPSVREEEVLKEAERLGVDAVVPDDRDSFDL